MEFHVKSDSKQTEFIGDGLILEDEEKDSLESLVANMVYGCGLVISSIIQNRTSDNDIRKKLADLSIRMLQDAVNSYLEGVHEQTLYDKMLDMYDEWFDNDCGYADEADLINDVIAYNVMPCFVYDEDADTVDVCLLPEDEDADFYELLGSIPVSLYKENQITAESIALAFEFIAVVLFDKAFGDGEDANPLRADDWVHLDKQFHTFLEAIESD